MSLLQLAQSQVLARSSWTGPINAKDPALAKLFSDAVPTTSGVPVTAENALTFSAVFDAVNQISGDVAKLPLVLHKRLKGGGSEPFTDSKLYWLLKVEPNPEMDTTTFRQTLQAHALTWHGGYAEIERDTVGRPVALWPITPDRVEPFRQDRGRDGTQNLGPLQYRIDGKTILNASDVLHIRGLGWSGQAGYSMVNLARQAIGVALATEQFQGAFFGNNAMFGGVLSSDLPLDPEQAKELKESIAKKHEGAARAFRLLVLNGGLKFQQFAGDAQKAQLTEARRAQVEEVARFFNMPVHKLKNLDRATNNNIEQQDLEYYKGCLLTWITRWEMELMRKLISPLERRQQFFKHNASAFLRGDIKSRYEALGVARDKGIINADEWRELEDMNPQPNGQGQLYLVQSAQVPVDRLAAMTDAQIKKLEAPQAPTPAQADPQAADAQARADQAEAALAEAQTQVETVRQAIADLEATGQATVEERDALAERVRQAEAQVATLEQIATDLRADVARIESTAAESLTALEATIAEREAALASATEATAAAEQRVIEAETAQADAQRALAAELEALKASTVQERDALTAQHQAALEAALAEATEARAALEAAEAERQQAVTEREAAVTAASDAQSAREQAEQTASDSLARQAAEQVRRQSVIAAHRAVVVDAVGRMVRREVQQARSKQATPDRLRRWLAGFEASHAPVCLEAFLPAMRLHLAWLGVSDDPAKRAGDLVRDQVTQFTAQLTVALESDPEDFHAVLDTILTRWESDRADAVADALMTEEIRHVADAS